MVDPQELKNQAEAELLGMGFQITDGQINFGSGGITATMPVGELGSKVSLGRGSIGWYATEWKTEGGGTLRLHDVRVRSRTGLEEHVRANYGGVR